ncbi:hypothetical protein Forpe1208_v012239 [Fusarium oxysporum f. sp. rapae]|uniref:DUF924 domain protein n=1 Tax=Fusarium oxysporum f. sp. rapae TaxID=485398 RepID=A0A8J5NYL7_FUSOX|nr:hypothetical protein Forpe1208_v012239 [Fusarium oxysporum f. sp. rapae]
MATSAQSSAELSQLLNPGMLANVREFWFRHLVDSDHFVIPDKEEAYVWFAQDDDFDQECISKFGPVLEFLSLNVKATHIDDLLRAANPTSALDWMSLIILLDQLPRNCYRGETASIAYRFFDVLALNIAFHAIAAGIPERPEIRYRHAYRFWFYMPLEHSETLKVVEIVVKEHDIMFGDSRELLIKDISDVAQDADSLYCREALIKRRDAFDIWEAQLRQVVNDHIATIRKYHRYPHRDLALGRKIAETAT